MKVGDKIRVMVVSGGSRYFTLHKIYPAKIDYVSDDGNHAMLVLDDNNEITRCYMFNTCHLNGGSFKQVKLEIVK